MALLLISVSFSLSVTIYIQILQGSNENQMTKARLYINEIYNNRYFQSFAQEDGLYFKIRQKPYDNNPDLTLVEIRVFSKDSSFLTQSKKIIRDN